MKHVYLLLLISIFVFSSCLKRRTWSSPSQKHLFYEVKIKNNSRNSIKIESKFRDNLIKLKLYKQMYCSRVQYDVKSLSISKTTKYSSANYYMLIGGIVMSLALPSYYLGFFESDGSASAIHFSVGTAVFFAPGGILAGYALWNKLKEKEETHKVGQIREVVNNKEYACGRETLGDGYKIEILTKTGYHDAGKTDKKGCLTFNTANTLPFYNRNKDEKYYLIYVNGEKVERLVIPPVEDEKKIEKKSKKEKNK